MACSSSKSPSRTACAARSSRRPGWNVTPEALTGVYKNMPRGIVALVFRCRQAAGTPQETREAVDVRWMTPDQIKSEMDEAYAVRMLDALREGPPSIRSHDGVNLE